MNKESLFLICPKCGEVKDLPYKHFLVAHRYKTTPFIVLCECKTAWDIQTGKLNWISDRVLEAVAQYSESIKEK